MSEKNISFNIYSSDDEEEFIGITSDELNDELEYREAIILILNILKDTMESKIEDLNYEYDNDDDAIINAFIQENESFKLTLLENIINIIYMTEQILRNESPTLKLIMCSIFDTHLTENGKFIKSKDEDYIDYPIESIISEGVHTGNAFMSILDIFTNLIDINSKYLSRQDSIDLLDHTLDFLKTTLISYLNDTYDEQER